MPNSHFSADLEDVIRGRVARVLRGRDWRERLISYIGYGNDQFVRVLGRVVLTRGQLPDDEADEWTSEEPDEPERHRGWRVFFTAPAVGVSVTVELPTGPRQATTDRGGYLDARFDQHGLEPGWHEIMVKVADQDQVAARVLILGADIREGLVSDIDDTIMVTALPRPLIAAWNTFVRHESARKVVPGMPEFYRRLLEQRPGAPIVYLSTGAWNTAPTLIRFMRRHEYPTGPMLMTDWGPTNTGWFRSGQEHKRNSLKQLAEDFPQIRWTLVGDDGQHDPDIYSEFAATHPEQVSAIAIRQLTPTEQVLAHGLPVPTEDLPTHGDGAKEQKKAAEYRAPDGFGLAQAMLPVVPSDTSAAD
ncbi:MAG TPA: phosphatase domain-containing protein [Propionibacteriaceae bacterium]|nr:phosphatase domain-containing protein [Propionibacteriaceae bacterium]